MRDFKAKEATREEVPLLIGLTGPSGGGKTYSALRLATGIQRVSGGEIFYVDTEARRALHYADKFKFKHVEFTAPFSPNDYIDVIKYCVDQGAKIVVIDSCSHEHEGPGGVLEMHEQELQRMGGRSSDNFRAWALPKQQRRHLINTILQLPIHCIFCFRAKEKVKPGKNKQLEDQGWTPIAGEEFIFELGANCLLLPGSNGVPTWHPTRPGEEKMIKLPEQFKALLASGPLDEDKGEAMARWAKGETVKAPRDKKELLIRIKAGLKKHADNKADQEGLAFDVFGVKSLADIPNLETGALEKGLAHLEGAAP